MQFSFSKILLIWPPGIPSYFNAGHRTPLFMAAEYLRKHFKKVEVKVVDAGALNYTWRDLLELFAKGCYDIVAAMNDYDTVSDWPRFFEYARSILPKSYLISFGRLSMLSPQIFRKLPLDANIESGDYEAGLYDLCNWLRTGCDKNKLPKGISLRFKSGWMEAIGTGRFLDCEDWTLPDIEEIPYASYDRLYATEENKFCGIPGARELILPVARGCSYDCFFCDIKLLQGGTERRLSVKRTIEYITKCVEKIDFDYFSFYIPTFTLHPSWVMDFCKHYMKMDIRLPWKCTTVLSTLSSELIEAMAKAGCVRISIGLETLATDALNSLPLAKRKNDHLLEHVAIKCQNHGIELNCFLILGLPGDTPQITSQTIEFLESLGCRVRTTILVQQEVFSKLQSIEEARNWNKQLFYDTKLQIQDIQSYYDIAYRRKYTSSVLNGSVSLQDRSSKVRSF